MCVCQYGGIRVFLRVHLCLCLFTATVSVSVSVSVSFPCVRVSMCVCVCVCVFVSGLYVCLSACVAECDSDSVHLKLFLGGAG